MKTKYAYLALEVNDIEENVKWYTDILQCKDVTGRFGTDKAKGSACVELNDGKCLVLRYSPKMGVKSHAFHGCIGCDDFLRADNYFVKRGIKTPYQPGVGWGKQGPCGCYSIFVSDPSGNRIEVHGYTEKSLQLKKREEILPLIPMIEDDTWVDPKNPCTPSSEDTMPPMRFEHIGLFTENVDKCVTFLRKIGFRIHFELYVKDVRTYTYIKCNNDFFFFEVSPGRPGMNGYANYRHVGLAVDDVDAAISELEEQGIKTTKTEYGFDIVDQDGVTYEFHPMDALD